eukprot:scaffold89152_cov42-Cyclotella_meneghiniana.AAC.2
MKNGNVALILWLEMVEASFYRDECIASKRISRFHIQWRIYEEWQRTINTLFWKMSKPLLLNKNEPETVAMISIERKERIIAKKEREIANLKEALNARRVSLRGDDEYEPAAKRPRIEMPATKSILTKFVSFVPWSTWLPSMKPFTEERENTESELEDTKEDSAIANETVQQQALVTDIWQRRFDELAALVGDKVDGAAVATIRDHLLLTNVHENVFVQDKMN